MGYLGEQPKFSALSMRTISHQNPEFALDNNEVEIQMKTPKPTKVTVNLISTIDDKDHAENVFTQTKDGVLSFIIVFPDAGFYKFQVFALEASDENTSLPNCFNYLIHVKNAQKAVHTFPKQFAQWKDGCYLYSPLVLNSKTSLTKIDFNVYVPNAKAVAVVCDGEWYHLSKVGPNWETKVDLHKHRGKNVKATLNANFGGDESKYATLLEYII